MLKAIFFLLLFSLSILDALDIAKLDYINLILVTIASIPLILGYVNNLEITTQGIKLSNKELVKTIENEGTKILGKIKTKNEHVKKILNNQSYLSIEDKNYALVKARIDIENRLTRIATINNCEECKSFNFYKNLEELNKRDLISTDLKNIIIRIYPLLLERTYKISEKHLFALDIADKIVETLNYIIELSLEGTHEKTNL